VKVIRELAEEQAAELADGMLSLVYSDGFPQLVELLQRLEQLAKDSAIDGKPEDLPVHRGWRDCAAFLQGQIAFLAARADTTRQERAAEKDEAPDEGAAEQTLWGLAAGDGNL
jgi:hypothetical protein